MFVVLLYVHGMYLTDTYVSSMCEMPTY